MTAKADSKFKIVGAASVAAKVTRDAWIEGWVYEETHPLESEASVSEKTWGDELGSGYPSGNFLPLHYTPCSIIYLTLLLRRPEDRSLDKIIARTYLWLPVACSIFVDNGKSGARKTRPRRQVVRSFYDPYRGMSLNVGVKDG